MNERRGLTLISTAWVTAYSGGQLSSSTAMRRPAILCWMLAGEGDTISAPSMSSYLR